MLSINKHNTQKTSDVNLSFLHLFTETFSEKFKFMLLYKQIIFHLCVNDAISHINSAIKKLKNTQPYTVIFFLAEQMGKNDFKNYIKLHLSMKFFSN